MKMILYLTSMYSDESSTCWSSNVYRVLLNPLVLRSYTFLSRVVALALPSRSLLARPRLYCYCFFCLHLLRLSCTRKISPSGLCSTGPSPRKQNRRREGVHLKPRAESTTTSFFPSSPPSRHLHQKNLRLHRGYENKTINILSGTHHIPRCALTLRLRLSLTLMLFFMHYVYF